MYDFMLKLGKLSRCHQRADRSFFWNGRKFPVCARCTGIFFGNIIAVPLFFIVRQNISFYLSVCLPLVIDGLTQYWGWQTSTNKRRFFTGIFAGYGICSLYIKILCIIINIIIRG